MQEHMASWVREACATAGINPDQQVQLVSMGWVPDPCLNPDLDADMVRLIGTVEVLE